MSHLEKDILNGKFGKNPQLKKEAREELAETKGKVAKKMKPKKKTPAMNPKPFTFTVPPHWGK